MRVFGWQTLMRSESKFFIIKEEVGRAALRATLHHRPILRVRKI